MTAFRGDASQAMAVYFWNSELCQGLYPFLQALEVALRNQLDVTISKCAPRFAPKDIPSWIDAEPSLLRNDRAIADVNHAKHKLLHWDEKALTFRRPIRRTHNDLVAAMSLGFWVGLLEDRYETPRPDRISLDDEAWREAFPGSDGVGRPTIRRTFGDIRRLRNRVFHHEPIWPKRAGEMPVEETFQSVQRVLGWLGRDHAKVYRGIHLRVSRPPFQMKGNMPQEVKARFLDAVGEMLSTR